MSSSIVNRIESKLEQLSPSEAQVGRWILGNMNKAADRSIMEVAQAVGVSEPTVIRFCRSIGLGGFRDLRTHLIAALQRPDSYLHHDVNEKDGSTDAAIKVLESSIRALVDLRESIAAMPFEVAANEMSAANHLIFAGQGASGIVARDACHKFFRLGLPCSTALDSPTILQHTAIARRGDVFIAISHNGRRQEMVQAMQLAAERGAQVIALTDPNSPLARVATRVFNCHPPEDTNIYTPMSSRLAQLSLLDSMQVALALKLGSVAEKNLRLTKGALLLSRPE